MLLTPIIFSWFSYCAFKVGYEMLTVLFVYLQLEVSETLLKYLVLPYWGLVFTLLSSAKLTVNKHPRSLSAELFSSHLSPYLYLCPALINSRLTFVEFHVTDDYSVLQFIWIPQQGLSSLQNHIPIYYYQQTCWGYIPFTHPDHWYTLHAWLALELSPGEHC